MTSSSVTGPESTATQELPKKNPGGPGKPARSSISLESTLLALGLEPLSGVLPPVLGHANQAESFGHSLLVNVRLKQPQQPQQPQQPPWRLWLKARNFCVTFFSVLTLKDERTCRPAKVDGKPGGGGGCAVCAHGGDMSNRRWQQSWPRFSTILPHGARGRPGQ